MDTEFSRIVYNTWDFGVEGRGLDEKVINGEFYSPLSLLDEVAKLYYQGE